MHNRVRMIVASFLVKDLHVEWQHGARHFLRWLVDGDLASNQHGWQWVAGCGTDAAPYFRVFNPTTQGRKFDPDGAYVRRWVPELADLDADATRTTPDDEARRVGYPAPIVDHAEERREALRRWERIRHDRHSGRIPVRELIVPQPLLRPGVVRQRRLDRRRPGRPGRPRRPDDHAAPWPTIAVSLRKPPPLDTPLRGHRRGRRRPSAALDGDRGRPGAERRRRPTPRRSSRCRPTRRAPPRRRTRGCATHPFPTCFACGTDREEGDGLRIFPGPVGDADGGPPGRGHLDPAPERRSRTGTRTSTTHRRASLAGHLGRARLRRRLGRRPRPTG